MVSLKHFFVHKKLAGEIAKNSINEQKKSFRLKGEGRDSKFKYISFALRASAGDSLMD